MDYYKEDTIAAIATPLGEGAIAIVRISGSEAFAIARKIFKGKCSFESHKASYGKILDEKGILDSVLLLPMKGPKSYTGEDLVEIHCHGGLFLTRHLLQRVLAAGARPASPGEFSYRAFLNKKMDLAQAESIQQIISAKHSSALIAAQKQLEGALSKQIGAFKEALTSLAAHLEASLDFPEEALLDLPPQITLLKKTILEMSSLANTFEQGKTLFLSLKLCIIGEPNVGKSSLLNALLQKERAIVTEIPGTTRDLLEEEVKIGPFLFRLIDTAGLRETTDKIEMEGINRAYLAMEEADYLLLVLDAEKRVSSLEKNLLASPKTIPIWNKTDLQAPQEKIEGEIQLSAKTKKGLDTLIQKLSSFCKIPEKEELILTKERHKKALDEAILFSQKTEEALENELPLELVLIDLKEALKALGKILGSDITEDILNSIFSTFCLGK